MSDTLHESIQKVFRKVFNDPKLVISETTTADDIQDWDSLMNINLVVAIERTFRIKFKLTEIQKLKNVGDLEVLVRSKISS